MKLEVMAVYRTTSSGCVVLLTLFAVASARAEVVIHVAPTGSDSNSGTAEKPVRTPHAARNLVRVVQAKSLEPVTVHFAAGTYYLADTFVLGSEDSGTEKAPVTYVASADGPVIFSGGVKLDLKWRPYKDGIMQAESAGPREGKGAFDQLFVNGHAMTMARYPNYNADARPFNGTAADAISPERVKRWADPVGAYVHALHANEWGDFHYRITGVDDKGNAKLEGGWQNNRRTAMHKRHRFVENVFEELDAPGEWYHDAAKKLLYCYPPKDVDLNKATVEAAGLRHLVEFRGTRDKPVRFVVMKGFTFTHAARTFMENREPLLRSDWTIYRGGAVVFEGCEDCGLDGCFFDQVGGNAVFVNKYNRRVAVTTCKIVDAGASGVCFVGDPKAVRSPLFEYGEKQPLEQIDRTPGPKTDDYPGKCRVHDCLIHGTGRVEKQSAGVEISMSAEITVSHCSIYEVPRAGINIGDGCWGGHVVEHNDVFDTVRETGDHGSFNSWGRDRYWLPNIGAVNQLVAKDAQLPFLDCRQPIVLRNNRWRCDHGWDIDLDDGSTNFKIENNVCLHGGLKLREGYNRTVENNVLVNNSFHPHVWFENSGDVFRHNVVGTKYQPIGMPKTWGKEVNANFFADGPSLKFAQNLGLDSDSTAGDPQFVDATKGDYRVKDGSAALKVGFKNFATDGFGVLSPRLRKEARTPRLPGVEGPARPEPSVSAEARRPNIIFVLTDDQGYGDLSCHGNPILKTPNLDRLHDEGVRFTDFHVSPTCSPTRSALMTGRHEFKNGVTHTILERERLTLKATTVAQVLKSAGYTTGIFGKWHLGDEPDHWPDKRGFEEMFIHGCGGIGQSYAGSCGDVPGNSYFNPTILHNGKFEKTKGYCTDVFFGQALNWMESVKGQKPFLCYLATNAPHAPLQVRPEDEKRYAEKVKDPNAAKFFGMIANIDDNVGRLLDKLNEWGIERDTLVIFMNDNGGTAGVSVFNAGMRGEKVTPWLGGTRAASFWRWPGTLKPGDVDRLAAHIDFFPTVAEIAGAKLPDDINTQVEGRSLLPLLRDPKAEWSDRTLFTHVGRWPKGAKPEEYKYAHCSVRSPRWHLVCDSRDGKKQWQLFDVKADPGEKTDVADRHPEAVKELDAAYDKWWDSVQPCLVNEDAVGPKVNPFKELYEKQFGGKP